VAETAPGTPETTDIPEVNNGMEKTHISTHVNNVQRSFKIEKYGSNPLFLNRCQRKFSRSRNKSYRRMEKII
jgi:hypothetical protein